MKAPRRAPCCLHSACPELMSVAVTSVHDWSSCWRSLLTRIHCTVPAGVGGGGAVREHSAVSWQHCSLICKLRSHHAYRRPACFSPPPATRPSPPRHERKRRFADSARGEGGEVVGVRGWAEFMNLFTC